MPISFILASAVSDLLLYYIKMYKKAAGFQ